MRQRAAVLANVHGFPAERTCFAQLPPCFRQYRSRGALGHHGNRFPQELLLRVSGDPAGGFVDVDKAIIGINSRNPHFHDLYLLDNTKSSLSQLYQNDQFINFVFDSNLQIVIKVRMNEDSSLSLLGKNDTLLFHISAEDAFHTECLRFDDQEQALYLVDNRECDTTKLKKIFLNESQQQVVLGEDPLSDIINVHFEGNKPVAYSTYYLQQ